MDFLCIPETPSRPLTKTLYPCGPEERWDGKSFLGFAHRKGLQHIVPMDLRPDGDPGDVPFRELIHPTPLDEQHRIYTTWFIFGLLAEFLGVNPDENGFRQLAQVMQPDEAVEELYQTCVATDAADGNRYLAMARLFDDNILGLLVYRVTATYGGPMQARLNHLSNCLRVTKGMLDCARIDFDPPLKCAIAALGEFLSLSIQASFAEVRKQAPSLTRPQVGFSWKSNMFQLGSEIREKMPAAGWCKSDWSRANAVYQNLQTLHYLSYLDRFVPGRDHGVCTEASCRAAQIDNATYKLSHAVPGCECNEFVVDIASIKRILLETDTFPVLIFDPDKTDLVVRKFEPGVEYIAISHVWADGLGNPHANTLHTCEIERLRALLKPIEGHHGETHPDSPHPVYHLWIDTLCCPVGRLEPVCNKISLNRMKAVYEKAAHVLVLDRALTGHAAEGLHPATALLRIFASSMWMRRLWTLQEGVLAQSLYVQFKDKPVHVKSLIDKLGKTIIDFRYWAIHSDIVREWNRFEDFRAIVFADPIKPPATNSNPTHKLYQTIQAAVDYRSVSVASDEAVCISTLLGRGLKRVLDVQLPDENVPGIHPTDRTKDEAKRAWLERDKQRAAERMRIVWEEIAKADEGIPARMIFLVDTPLPQSGWGWAPNSLLGYGDSAFNTPYKTLEYVDWPTGLADSHVLKGVPTGHGLRVDLPGLTLEARPLVPGVPLHAWDGVLSANSKEDFVYFQDVETGRWFRMQDWHASTSAGTPPDSHPLCTDIDSGKIALIKGEDNSPYRAMLWLMVEVLNEVDGSLPSSSQCNQEGRRVRWLRKVIVSEVQPQDVVVIATLQRIARQVASGDATMEFALAAMQATNTGTPSEKYAVAREGLRQKLKDAVAESWKTEPEFVEAVTRTVGDGMEEYIWTAVPMWSAHQVVSREVPQGRVWFVD
ncbi:hypothetical protein B0T22DRAFT_535200 [Podospora appendiculata]|uniref:Heterokaryon incompatibility domain-containing protein n=1 Tax=Podospora appendiculata TaxID=314037 RepID=A0AAE1CBY1_9PEZI|nr:hypothetical protein B0T22DRAFT_535200 [Podospora appendiculata]